MTKDEVTVNLLHNGKVVRSLTTNLDTLHKLIGVMSYGGWKPNPQTKFLVDDYHFVQLEPFVIEVNLMTEAEVQKRNQDQMNAQYEKLNEEFKEKLKPLFKRNPESLN